MEHPFATDNTIIKVNVDDPSGVNNKQFKTDPSLVLHEPWFVARPDARREDDGVLIVKALDTSENKGKMKQKNGQKLTYNNKKKKFYQKCPKNIFSGKNINFFICRPAP